MVSARDTRTLNLFFGALNLALLVVLLTFVYGVKVPFFAALVATPLVLAMLVAISFRPSATYSE